MKKHKDHYYYLRVDLFKMAEKHLKQAVIQQDFYHRESIEPHMSGYIGILLHIAQAQGLLEAIANIGIPKSYRRRFCRMKKQAADLIKEIDIQERLAGY